MGCIGGAGQPFSYIPEKRERAKGLYTPTNRLWLNAQRNPVVIDLYENGVLKNKAHELLHVHYHTCDNA